LYINSILIVDDSLNSLLLFLFINLSLVIGLIFMGLSLHLIPWKMSSTDNEISTPLIIPVLSIL